MSAPYQRQPAGRVLAITRWVDGRRRLLLDTNERIMLPRDATMEIERGDHVVARVLCSGRLLHLDVQREG